MRTTLTLDEDVVKLLRTGASAFRRFAEGGREPFSSLGADGFRETPGKAFRGSPPALGAASRPQL